MGREIGYVELEITMRNGNYHGRLIECHGQLPEDGETIWSSRGESSPGPIHTAAENWLGRLPDDSYLVEIR